MSSTSLPLITNAKDDKTLKQYSDYFAGQLRAWRKEHRISQGELAKRLGTSTNTISSYERGDLPSATNLINVANLLCLPLDTMLGRDKQLAELWQYIPTQPLPVPDEDDGAEGEDDYELAPDAITLGMLARQIIGMDASAQAEGDADTPTLNVDKLRSFLDQYYRYKQTVSDIADPNALNDMYSVWLNHELEALDEIPLED